MSEIPTREDAFHDFWKKTETRRMLLIARSGKSKDEVAKAIYVLCAELCSLQHLLIMHVFKS